MNNRLNTKGFTLIELLAVVVILGIIMTIAIPNIIDTLDKNKKNSFLKEAKRAVTSVEYVIRSNPTCELPSDTMVVVVPLNRVKNIDINSSPYDTYYSMKDSFVAIVKSAQDYEYYIHLVSCKDSECKNEERDSMLQNRGINLVKLSELDEPGATDLVVRGEEVVLDYLRDESKNYTKLIETFKQILNKQGVNLTLGVYPEYCSSRRG